MCGIFGYIGPRDNAASMIYEGLKGLEYRGYDSWGISVKVNGKIALEKHIGKIGKTKINLPKSTIGIGHTRWATHGGVTVENAHPHVDCTGEIAVLHNGIIENFSSIKEELLKKGHIFSSETDTEVVPHLIEEYLKKEDFPTAVRLAFSRLQGLNAIVAVHTFSDAIVGAKNGSPLVVGVGEGEFFIASDAVEIVKYTKNVIFIEDNQMVVLDKKLRLYSLPEGKEIKPEINTLDWAFEQSEKGKFEHFLLKEISEQPRVIKTLALNSKQDITELADLITHAFGTFLLGCGTSSYAALAGTYLFSSIAKKHVNFAIGSEFSYLEDYLTDKSLLIPISQSGETIDIVEPVSKAKNKKHAKVAALTNVLGSTLYRLADIRVLLNAGPEKAVIGTKSFVAMISILILTAYTLANRFAEGQTALLQSGEDVELILEDNRREQIRKLAKYLKDSQHVFILGRGLSYPTALEAALKLKETAYIHAEGFAAGELKHGVISLIEKGTPCIFITPNDKTFDEIISNAQEVKSRGGYIIGIGPRENDVFDVFLKTADSKEATLISQVVIVQLLAYELALIRGIEDPDKPRNLAKSVTVK